jgi:hypothetical protein
MILIINITLIFLKKKKLIIKMFFKDGNTYRKVYTRKNGSKFFVRNGKRVDFFPSQRHTIVSVKLGKDCPHGKERLPSGRCSKKMYTT